jgi:hypothetical protein
MLGMMLAASAVSTTAFAGAVIFTWDPSAASPALGGTGSAFTADTVALASHKGHAPGVARQAARTPRW